MALAEQTEFAFMKAAKGTDVPKAEVIELHQDVARYKKMFPKLTSDEILTILRELMPEKAQMNAKGGVIKAQKGTDVVRAEDRIIDIKTEEDQIQALIDHSDGVLSREEALFFLRDIKKQYGLQDGGLLDQGGSKDPVSGNDVPIGSLKEEVRDDIPAMLSEGEFVFPADVTRYYGLDTLMKMRQKAKQGLKVMEAMGQMGNSEDATIPDDIPFDMDDLELAEGGVVKAQQGIYMPPEINPPAMTLQPGFGTAPELAPTSPLPNVGGYTPPPIADPTPKSFTDLMGSAGYDELRTYVNDQGQQMQIPFKGGEPLSAIPEGYKPKDTVAETTVRPTFTTATDTAQSSTDRPAVPQTVEQQRTADDARVDEIRKRGVDPEQGFISGRPANTFTNDQYKEYLKQKNADFKSREGFAPRTLEALPLTGVLTRFSDREIRYDAGKKLIEGQYRDEGEYQTLVDVVKSAPIENPIGLNILGKDQERHKERAEKALAKGYQKDKAATFAKKADRYKIHSEALRDKGKTVTKDGKEVKAAGLGVDKYGNKRTQVEMTNMLITQNPSRDAAIMSGESNSEREVRERKEADALNRAAQMDAFVARENNRIAESIANEEENTTGQAFSQETVGPSGSADGTHCCTASYKQKTMTISEVKELRRWHRKQSQIWQDGYDVWGKYVADGLVAKSKWQASVVKSVHDLIIKKKLTLKGLYGIIVISSGVYPIGLFKRIIKHGRIFQST